MNLRPPWNKPAGRSLTSWRICELESALKLAAGLRPAVDRYFEDVLVMDKDERVRANRLAQLAAVAALVRQLGEFSRLPVTAGVDDHFEHHRVIHAGPDEEKE